MAGQSKLSTADDSLKSTKHRYILPAIGIDHPSKKELKKDEYITYKLHSIPTVDDSPTYNLTVPYFNTGTTEELFLFLKAVKKVIDGQNLTVATDKYVLMRRCLLGDALAAFNTIAMQFGDETNEKRQLEI